MKRTAILCGLLGLMAGCDNDTSLPPYTATIFLEDFEEVQNSAISLIQKVATRALKD